MPRTHTLVLALALTGAAAIDGAAARAQTPEPGGRLPAQTGWVRFEVLAGRVTATRARCGQNRSVATGTPVDDVREVFSVDVVGAAITAHYEWCDAEQDLIVDVTGNDQLEIRREPRGDSKLPALRFTQRHGQPVVLDVGDGPERRQWSAASLWHLALVEPNATRQGLFPILETLRHDWGLAQTADRAIAELARQAESSTYSPPDWNAHLDELGSGSFAQRRSATVRLTGMGPQALGYLTGADASRLDAEQRQNVERIIERLQPRVGDAPEWIAAWLSEDRAAWLSLLHSDDATVRKAAAAHLARMSGRTIEFDPLASEDVRRAQITRLRSRLVAR